VRVCIGRLLEAVIACCILVSFTTVFYWIPNATILIDPPYLYTYHLYTSMAKMEDTPHHVLDFLLDDEDSCALTVYMEDNVRMHIIADVNKFKNTAESSSTKTHAAYSKLVEEFRNSSDEERVDSGVEQPTKGKDGDGVQSEEDVEENLQNWILGPVRRKISENCQQPTLDEWYEAETLFFELEISKDDELRAVEIEASSELKRRIARLKPEISLPKYIRDMDYPWFDSRKLTVLAGSGSPPPYHPTQVRCEETGKTYFFKAVDSDAPKSTKRELWHLNRIAKPDIVDQICAPRLVGLVAKNTSTTKAIGFLQEDIPNPTPLTNRLDASIPQVLRDAWATEAERMKNVLHEHNIIWGDAKADNFLVDKNDKLWIIDFGGSWTEGWIDPEIKETVEGDDMALEKITNALHDPVANVEGASEEPTRQEKSNSPDSNTAQGLKRKASESDVSDSDRSEESHQHRNGDTKKHKLADEPEEEETVREVTPPSDTADEPIVVPTPQKRRKSEVVENQEAERYCYCDSPSAGPMVGCDNPDCERQWFHFYCAGLKESPPDDVAWFCRDCTA
jgi:tRNA A-37 threonylcarbamoyl transferase component Bud32